MSLVNMTFDWIKKEWAEEVDFVIWTGDNARCVPHVWSSIRANCRHDIDRSLPRTPQEIFELNTMMVDKMMEVIPKDIPIVPSLGNNDIYPHNVLAAGPNRITEHFLGSVMRFCVSCMS
jgi:endopolyphosphatase